MKISSAIRKLRRPDASLRIGLIGIEFSLDAINVVQFDRGSGQHVPRSVTRCAYPVSRQATFETAGGLAALLRETIKGGNFSGRKVVAALPSPELKILQIQYPQPRDGGESRVILEMVGDRLPDPLSEYVIDYIPVRHGSRDGQKLALVAVSRRRVVLDLLHNLRKARLDPHAIEIAPVAIRRLVASLTPPDVIQNILVVNVGERKTFLTMISGRRLLMDQEVAIGREQLLEMAAEQLDVTREQAQSIIARVGLRPEPELDQESRDEVQTLGLVLTPGLRRIADEIEKAFGYAASVTRGAPARRILLSGCVTRWPGAQDLLSEVAGAPVERIPSPVAQPDDEDPDSAGDLAVAAGLALRGIVDDD